MSNIPLSTDERLDKIDTRFVALEKLITQQGSRFENQYSSINKQLDRIASTVVKGFEQNKREHDQMATKSDVERIFRSLDAMAKRQEISDEERLVMGHQLDRVNRWIKDLADKIGYELTY